MPKLVVFFMRHALVGMGIAFLFVSAVLGFDVSHIGTLVRNSSSGLLAVVMLFVFSTVTFSSLQISMAVMLLPRDTDQNGGGGGSKALAWFSLPRTPALAQLPAQKRRRY